MGISKCYYLTTVWVLIFMDFVGLQKLINFVYVHCAKVILPYHKNLQNRFSFLIHKKFKTLKLITLTVYRSRIVGVFEGGKFYKFH